MCRTQLCWSHFATATLLIILKLPKGRNTRAEYNSAAKIVRIKCQSTNLRPIFMSQIKYGLIYIAKMFFTLIFLLVIRTSRKKRLFIFDIDNTIADSWPSLLISDWHDQNHRIRSLGIFLKMRRLILALKISPSNQILYMTARSNFSWIATCNWLNSVGIEADLTSVIITRTPDDKLDLLKLINRKAYYIDDLSLGQETGTTIVRTDLIAQIEELPLQYFGKKDIDQFIS